MIIIEFQSKNFALIKRESIESQYVPRVGELIDGANLADLSGDDVRNFFVTKVVYEATKTGLVPVITCKQWLNGLRQQELEERGWLPNTTGHTIHDDD